MWIDAPALDRFYHTPLGVQVQQLLGGVLEDFYQETHGEASADQAVSARAVLGYADPLLQAENAAWADGLLRLYPAALWEEGGVDMGPTPPGAVWCHEQQVPLLDQTLQQIAVVHALEQSDQPHALLRECWRVLAPEGSLLLVVPHRYSLWSRAHGTPFGHGRPFSSWQLQHWLSQHGFHTEEIRGRISLWPTHRRALLSLSQGLRHTRKYMERQLVRCGMPKAPCWLGMLGSAVLVARATKRMGAPTPVGGLRIRMPRTDWVGTPALPMHDVARRPQ